MLAGNKYTCSVNLLMREKYYTSECGEHSEVFENVVCRCELLMTVRVESAAFAKDSRIYLTAIDFDGAEGIREAASPFAGELD